MAILYRILAFGIGSVMVASTAQAQTDVTPCRAIANPESRLACYDQLAGGAPAATPSHTTVPAPMPAPTPASPPASPAYPVPAPAPAPTAGPTGLSYATLRKRSNFDAMVQTIEPLPHGLFRLHLEDGTAYDTSMEGARISQGITVHIRRSPLGTTFVDLPGQAPIPVRLFRPE